MIVLDENVREDQRQRLRGWRIRVRRVGLEVGQKGIPDDSLIRLLQTLTRPTLFTQDQGLYSRRLANRAYCLVCLNVGERNVAEFTRRILRHPLFNTWQKRRGSVVLVAVQGLRFWRSGLQEEQMAAWPGE